MKRLTSSRRRSAEIRSAVRPVASIEGLERRALFAYGDLDAGFSGDGVATASFGPSGSALGNDAVALPGGKVLVAGSVQGDFALLRYNADGSLDTGFGGGDGIVTADMGSDFDSASAIALAPGGKIVLAGSRPSGTTSFAVARFNADGSPDQSFSGDGKTTTTFANGAWVNDVVVTPDGGVVAVGGTVRPGFGGDAAAARYMPDGSLDTRFGVNGRLVTSVSPSEDDNGTLDDDQILAAALLTGGDVIVGGYYTWESSDKAGQNAFIASLDGIGSGGQTVYFGDWYPGSSMEVQEIRPLAGGDLLLAGLSDDEFVVIRVSPAGDTRREFGSGGFASIDSAGYHTAGSMDVDAEGRIVLASQQPDRTARVAHFTPAGRPDATFNEGREVEFSYDRSGPGDTSVGAVLALPGGKALVVGHLNGQAIGMAQFAADGTPDRAFGGDGRHVTVFPGDDTVAEVLPLAGGAVIEAGTSTGLFAVAKFTASGEPDRTFGGDGKNTTSFGKFAVARAATLTGDGRVLLAGEADGDIAFARFRADGALDTGFGPTGSGRSTIDPSAYGLDRDIAATDVAVLSNGKIVVSGTAGGSYGGTAFVARFNSDCTVDRTFGRNGIALPGEGSDSPGFVEATTVEVLPSGELLVAGQTNEGLAANWVVARLGANGTLDTTFGGGSGRAIVDFGSTGAEEMVKDLVVRSDGRIILVGSAPAVGDNADFTMARLTASGQLDRSFGRGGADGDGKVSTDFTPARTESSFKNADSATSVALLGGDRIVVAGLTRGRDPVGNFSGGGIAVAFYTADGALDTAAAGDGKTVIASGDVAVDVAATAQGHVVVGGHKHSGGAHDFVVARLVGPGGATSPQVYQAESATLSGPVVRADYGGFTGTGYADYVNATGDYVEFTVQVPSAGRYALEFRYANGGGTERSLVTSVNGSDGLGLTNFAPTGSWSTWRTAATQSPLSAGANTVRLAAAGRSGPNLDSLTVRPIAATQTYEAEEATLAGPTVARSHGGYTGAGYADFVRASGDFVEWAVTAGESREYVLEFRYANGSTLDRALRLTSDGMVVRDRLSFAPTGSWSTWRTVRVELTLAAGTHKIRLAAAGRSGPNVDSLTVS